MVSWSLQLVEFFVFGQLEAAGRPSSSTAVHGKEGEQVGAHSRTAFSSLLCFLNDANLFTTDFNHMEGIILPSMFLSNANFFMQYTY